MNYHVNVAIQDDSHALAETRGHTMMLNVRKGAGEAGFNAAETLLAALGKCACTLTRRAWNLTLCAATSHLS
jgi:hypothetical protein